MLYFCCIIISEKIGVGKTQGSSVNAIEGFGIEGDGHAGAWDRHISLLPIEAFEKVPSDKIEEVKRGGFTENITISGISFADLNLGTLIQIREDTIKIHYIGKEEFKGSPSWTSFMLSFRSISLRLYYLNG